MASRRLKVGILTIHSKLDIHDINADVEEICIYNSDIMELIDYSKRVVRIKIGAEIIDLMLEIEKHAIMDTICCWCDKEDEIDIIFIVGYPFSWADIHLENDFNELIKKMINEQGFKRHTAIVSKIKMKLESRYHRIICGERNNTLIINLFGFYHDCDLLACFDIIATVLQNERKLIDYKKSMQDIASSSNNDCTDQIGGNKIKSHEKSIHDLDIHEEDNMNKAKRHKESSNKFIEEAADRYESGYYKKLSSSSEFMKQPIVAKEETIVNEPSTSSGKMPIVAKVATIVSEPSTSFNKMIKKVTESSIIDKEASSSEIMYEVDLKNIVSYVQNPMISINEALLKIRRIVAHTHERNCDVVKINNAHGRILFETVYANCNVPAFRVSTKNGYAILANDGEGVRTVLIKTTSNSISLKPGTCVMVKSGARIPDEATAVVQISDTKRIMNYDGTEESIQIMIKPENGQNIKNVGSDIRKNELIIHPYTRIGPAELGLLAATGHQDVIVVAPISIGILSIGEFLAEPGESLRPGYVYDSNRISLIALLKDKGFYPILDFGIVADIMLPIMKRIKQALKEVDVLVTIGCTNDNDVLKLILKNDPMATIHFGNVNVKPGKSTMFATYRMDKTKCILCLPGNPVSAFISAHLFLLPLLNECYHIAEKSCKIPVCINQRFILHPRPRVAWTVLKWNDQDNFARAFNKENLVSDKLSSSQAANALLMLPQKTEDLKEMYPSFVPALLINFSNSCTLIKDVFN
ncbi:gephyrin-like isoform X2 [Formica exsecta]|uniref:gephyrin-like isoform X2 n=1 Tax=Formica exsecta TaxID=72781 RepID=UPI001144A85F|nr:gephyrin-like isoform X2 [Formica exsecta]